MSIRRPLNVVLQIMTHHRWGAKAVISPNKTERECERCGLIKTTRHEPDNWPPHWAEFWRGLDRIEGTGTPKCSGAPPERTTYNARNYPL